MIRSQTGSYSLGFVFLACFALICCAVNYWVFLQWRAIGHDILATE